MSERMTDDNRRRDSVSLLIIGTFFALFSVLVLIGTFWEHRTRAIIVNIASGLALMLVGIGMALYGYWLRRAGGLDKGKGHESGE